jgi:CubicO group peptidase (beta-lactamase class C family)
MAPGITRRRLLGDGARAAFVLAAAPALVARAQRPVGDARGRAREIARLKPAFDRLDAFAKRHMREVGAPGMTIALADRGGLLRASVHGFADVKARTPVTPATLFQIGSISKSLVAIALLRLRDEGKFDPERPVAQYLPWLEIASEYAPITGHHLLSHTSGLFNTVDAGALFPRGPFARPWAGFAPGERFYYSNTGYLVLGYLLEELGGRPFPESLRARALDPLGMSASEPAITDDARPRMAVGYAPPRDDRAHVRGGPLAEATWFEFDHAAGSVAATPADMGAYLRVLLNRGEGGRGRVLSEESFALLVRPVVKTGQAVGADSYGYGLRVAEEGGRTVVRHTGGMVAFSSSMAADLGAGVGAFASVNARLGPYRPNAVVEYALDLLRAASEGKPLPPPPEADPSSRVANAADYEGEYASPDGGKLAVVAEGNALLLVRNGRKVALDRTSGDSFVARDPDLAAFAFEFGREDGDVVEVFHGPDWYTSARYAGPRAFENPAEWAAYAGHYRSDNPWVGTLRVVLRKGRLWLDGSEPLVPLGQGTFRVGAEAWSPERASFEAVVDGKARRMNLSGVDLVRESTP